MGKKKSLVLLVFHSFSDTTSTFYGQGKKSAWEAWNCLMMSIMQAFTYMTCHPYVELNVNTPHFHLLEHFTIILYNKTNNFQHACINEARQQLICQKEKVMEKLTLTRMLCSSIQSVQPIRLEYGAPLSRLNDTHSFSKRLGMNS